MKTIAQRLFSITVFASIVAYGTGCSSAGAADNGCSKDSDCASGRICNDERRCSDRSPPGAEGAKSDAPAGASGSTTSEASPPPSTDSAATCGAIPSDIRFGNRSDACQTAMARSCCDEIANCTKDAHCMTFLHCWNDLGCTHTTAEPDDECTDCLGAAMDQPDYVGGPTNRLGDCEAVHAGVQCRS